MSFLLKICRFSLGDFEDKEFKYFVRVGLLFLLLIGIYWTLRPLKDSLFIQMAGKAYIPYAKTASLFFLIPMLALYSKLLQSFTKETIFKILIYFFLTGILLVSVPVFLFQTGFTFNKTLLSAIGYCWYIFVESFGSIMVAFFWGLLTDITDPQSAKKGFALIYFFGQIGGAILPLSITKMPVLFGVKTDIVSMLIVACLIYLMLPISKNFIKQIPQDKINKDNHGEIKKTKFIDGVKLLCSHKYLMALFLMEFSFEFVITIVDFNFKMLAGTVYSGIDLTAYLGKMASAVNMTSGLILLFLSNRIQRIFGIKAAILFIPVVVGSVFLFFINSSPSLQIMFFLVIVGKAVNYAFRSSFKQLYIPTTPEVHFRLQGWNDVFAARGGKQVGSIFNMLFAILGKAKYLAAGKAIGFPLIIVWVCGAIYLGKTCEKAISEKKIII